MIPAMKRSSLLLATLVLSLSAGAALARTSDKLVVAGLSGSLDGASFKSACTDGSFSTSCVDVAAGAGDLTTEKVRHDSLADDPRAPVPEPSTLMLVAAGLAAIGFVGSRRLGGR